MSRSKTHAREIYAPRHHLHGKPELISNIARVAATVFVLELVYHARVSNHIRSHYAAQFNSDLQLCPGPWTKSSSVNDLKDYLRVVHWIGPR